MLGAVQHESHLFGLIFSEGLLKKGSFLDDYMRGSWVDRMAVHQLDQAA